MHYKIKKEQYIFVKNYLLYPQGGADQRMPIIVSRVAPGTPVCIFLFSCQQTGVADGIDERLALQY